MGKVFVQIGAGAGDRDPNTDYRDGFSEFVKAQDPRTIDNVVLVEPNPANIAKLQECWINYPQAAVFQIGIVPDNVEVKSMEFFWAPEDGPHFQVFSCIPEHVLKHYPDTKLESIHVQVLKLSDFLTKILGNRAVDYLALDIEGLDAEILLNTDFSKLNVANISFETLHLGDRDEAVLAHLAACGFEHAGLGFDVHGWDMMYRRKA